MGKKLNARTHKHAMDMQRGGLSPEAKRQANNQRRKAAALTRKARLRAETEVRQRERDKLSPAEQLQRLDWRLGNGKGAKRERSRLKKLLESQKEAQKSS